MYGYINNYLFFIFFSIFFFLVYLDFWVLGYRHRFPCRVPASGAAGCTRSVLLGVRLIVRDVSCRVVSCRVR